MAASSEREARTIPSDSCLRASEKRPPGVFLVNARAEMRLVTSVRITRMGTFVRGSTREHTNNCSVVCHHSPQETSRNRDKFARKRFRVLRRAFGMEPPVNVLINVDDGSRVSFLFLRRTRFNMRYARYRHLLRIIKLLQYTAQLSRRLISRVIKS